MPLSCLLHRTPVGPATVYPDGRPHTSSLESPVSSLHVTDSFHRSLLVPTVHQWTLTLPMVRVPLVIRVPESSPRSVSGPIRGEIEGGPGLSCRVGSKTGPSATRLRRPVPVPGLPPTSPVPGYKGREESPVPTTRAVPLVKLRFNPNVKIIGRDRLVTRT